MMKLGTKQGDSANIPPGRKKVSPPTMRLRVRGTCVALNGSVAPLKGALREAWGAVLLRGASGSGKSDFALRILDHLGADGARLVSDDYVDLDIDLSNGRSCAAASPPDTIAGRMEVRGVGVVETDFLRGVPLRMLVDLVDAGAVERLPLEREEVIYTAPSGQGLALPVVACAPFENSSVIKLLLSYKRRVGAEVPAAGTQAERERNSGE